MTRKVYIRTFGCQMNEYDSAKMADVLHEAEGLETTERVEDADADHEIRPRLLQVLDASEVGEHLLLRLLAHGAGIEQQQVGLGRIVGQLIALRLAKHVHHLGGVVLVHLAAEGPDIEQRHGALRIEAEGGSGVAQFLARSCSYAS